MRKALIAGNWKMFKTVPEALALVGALRDDLGKGPVAHEVLVAPPFTALGAVSEALKGSRILVAGQNMHAEQEGAFTGEISAGMLKSAGASHVILGHSERRQLFGETDEGVGRKARVAFDAGLVPIVCVGETLDEREAGRIFAVVERQLDAALTRLTPDEAASAVVAYEPVWAIGTGRVATPEQAQDVHAFIRKRVHATHGEGVAQAQRILYGGSVKPDNVDGLMAQPDIDGALVGGACLKADSFLRIVRFVA
jgi:triosephosphate isomerase